MRTRVPPATASSSALDEGARLREHRDLGAQAQDRAVVPDKPTSRRLDKLIVDAILKSGDKYADAGKYAKAATFYLRVPKEPTVDAKTAADAMMNAGVMYEKAKRPEDAAGRLPRARREVRRQGARSGREGRVRRRRRCTSRRSTTTAPRRPTSSWSSKFGSNKSTRRPPTHSTTPGSCARRWARTSRRSPTTRAYAKQYLEPQGRPGGRVQHRRGVRGRRPGRARVQGVRRLRADLRVDGQARDRGPHARGAAAAQARPGPQGQGGARHRAGAVEARERRREGRGQAVGGGGSVLPGRADLQATTRTCRSTSSRASSAPR